MEEPLYNNFTFSEGTYDFYGRDAIIVALIRKKKPMLSIATFSREVMQETCRLLKSTPLPQFEPTADAALRDGEGGKAKPDSHYRSKRAADKIATNHPEFLETLCAAWTEAFNEKSDQANTLAGNRTESYVT